jgi:hypothetical protein
MRVDAVAWRTVADEPSLRQSLQGAHDVANFLRRNVVQLRKTPEKDADGSEIYRASQMIPRAPKPRLNP